MVLDFGLLTNEGVIQTADYKSAGSHQIEAFNYDTHTSVGAYEAFYTVSSDKTHYISSIIVHAATAGCLAKFATGGAGTEVDFMGLWVTQAVPANLSFDKPIKVSGGTSIRHYCSTADTLYICFVGFEE